MNPAGRGLREHAAVVSRSGSSRSASHIAQGSEHVVEESLVRSPLRDRDATGDSTRTIGRSHTSAAVRMSLSGPVQRGLQSAVADHVKHVTVGIPDEEAAHTPRLVGERVAVA